MSPKPLINVTCAIILREGKVLCAQRSERMSLPLKWEFPGGKLMSNESPEVCIERELREELDITVRRIRRLKDYPHDYGSVVINLIPFVCEFELGVVTPSEHKEIRWLPPDSLLELDWAAADIPIVKDFVTEYYA